MSRIGICALFALAVITASAGQAQAVSRDPRDIPLVDQRGLTFRLSDLTGSATFVTFVATRCTAVCPIANGEFERLDGLLARDHVRATLVTVTLDPSYDTPFVMSRFARFFGTRGRWRFASGSVTDVRSLMAALGVSSTRGAAEHSAFIYVLDRHARLARTLLPSDAVGTDVEATARALDARP